MATFEEAWIYLLQNGAQLSSIIGSRVYADVLPANVTIPAATFLLPSDIPYMAHDGDSGLATAVVQVDWWSDSRIECAQMKSAGRADLLGYSGITQGFDIRITRMTNVPDNNPELTLKRYISEFTVQYKAVS